MSLCFSDTMTDGRSEDEVEPGTETHEEFLKRLVLFHAYMHITMHAMVVPHDESNEISV